MCNDEHPILDTAALNTAYSAYRRRMGEYPAANEELTSEHITSLHTRFQEVRPPYVDSALKGPQGQRILRKVKFRGCRLEADGSIGTIEITGLP